MPTQREGTRSNNTNTQNPIQPQAPSETPLRVFVAQPKDGVVRAQVVQEGDEDYANTTDSIRVAKECLMNACAPRLARAVQRWESRDE